MSTKIEWADETTNVHVGCTKESDGCKNCYAIGMAYRLMHIGHSAKKYAGTVVKTAAGNLNWTGRINYDQDVMQKWLSTKKPTHYFVNSMSDLFHEDIPFEQIYKVFQFMHLAHWHSFQVLTKRAERLNILDDVYFHLKRNFPDGQFPLKNVLLCVSVENQTQADERIKYLLDAPAVKRGLSMEPLLGPVNLAKVKTHSDPYETAATYTMQVLQQDSCYEEDFGEGTTQTVDGPEHPGIDQVIVGGESGLNARPMHPDWVRQIRDQCNDYEVPFFFKQWGEWRPFDKNIDVEDYKIEPDGKLRMVNGLAVFEGFGKERIHGGIVSAKSFDEETNKVTMVKVGKHDAGRLLDGLEHNGMANN